LNKKILLLIILVLIIVGQLTVLSSFFHPFQTENEAFNTSIVEVSKLAYVFGWVTFQISGAGPQNPVVLRFQNGSQINITSDYTFQERLPRTGDCYCSASTGLPGGVGVSIDQTNPIAAAVAANASSFDIQALPSAFPFYGTLFDLYWFEVVGNAYVTINGYGVSY